MIRRGIIVVSLLVAAALLTLTLYIHIVQSPAALWDRANAPMPIKLPTDAIWVRSFSNTTFAFFMLDDRVRLYCLRSDNASAQKWRGDISASLDGSKTGDDRWIVISSWFGGHLRPGSIGVGFPLWMPFLLLCVYPAIAFISAYRRQRRQARGLCVRCAYNLTENVSGVCPECGTPVVPASEPAVR